MIQPGRYVTGARTSFGVFVLTLLCGMYSCVYFASRAGLCCAIASLWTLTYDECDNGVPGGVLYTISLSLYFVPVPCLC